MENLILFIVGFYVVIHIIYSYRFYARPTPTKKLSQYIPVSIIIAVRNEEKNLPRLLFSLVFQDYPKELIEVIIGNDQSEDNSLPILQEWAKKYPFIKVVNIEKNLKHLKGKQNVLAQLIPLASHEHILITDADICLPKTWVSTMLAHLESKTMISAPTIVEGNQLFHHLQSLEWLFSISVIKPFSDWGFPITAVGNNMGFKKSEYLKIGGYENLPFSLTEDYILFEKMILKNKGSFEWVHLPEVLNISKPAEDLKTFLHQHKRWYEGAKKGPWYAIFIFLYHILIYPTLIASFWYFPFNTVFMLWGYKWTADFVWLMVNSEIFHKQDLIKHFFYFQVYFMAITLLLPWYFWLTTKVEWKGRIYE